MNEKYNIGQRYIGCGKSRGKIVLDTVPGNALGAYLDGAEIILHANAQDETGDTMNSGSITIHGSTGDAAGYAMRGGDIYIRDNAGYRAGIHMKEYKSKVPHIIVGGRCGSFLGEYQAGGIIVVLGIGYEGRSLVGNFCGTGMHGGKIYLRTDHLPEDLPKQVAASEATKTDLEEIEPLVEKFCEKFEMEKDRLMSNRFYVLRPNTSNPYKRLYIQV
jgi:glutamate synthase domain-containing protein 3